MTKISRKRITREGQVINDFWRTVTFLESKEEVKNFLKALLTSTEMLMLAKRVDVARMLMSDCKYDFIKREAQVTNATIAHVKDCLVNGAFYGYLAPLQRLEDADAKVRNRTKRKLERLNFRRTTLSGEVVKVVGKLAVHQYKKWKKFNSAKQ
jgi:TrpR-related protein YerC/YecD